MTLNDFKTELKNLKITKYKALNLAMGISALLIYEFIGLPVYRPYIYTNKINDFYIADTLGNTLGTTATVFSLVAILSHEPVKGNYLIKIGTFSVIVFELMHPLLGKPIDARDIVATIITGILCDLLYNRIFRNNQ